MSRLPFHSLVFAIALACAGCGEKPPPAPPPPEVLVVEAVARDVPVISEWLGTTEGSVDAADPRAGRRATWSRATTEEGQRVKAGDLLFRIDPRPFQAALEQARGDLGRARSRRSSSRASTSPATRRSSRKAP